MSDEKQHKHITALTSFFDEFCSRCHEIKENYDGGCCKSCAYYRGYNSSFDRYLSCGIKLEGDDDGENLSYSREDDRFEYLKKKYDWNEYTGFLQESGCVLPRHERSIACLVYLCENGVEYFKEKYNIDVTPFQRHIFEQLVKLRDGVEKEESY